MQAEPVIPAQPVGCETPDISERGFGTQAEPVIPAQPMGCETPESPHVQSAV